MVSTGLILLPWDGYYEEEEQPLKLALRTATVWSASDFIFLASVYEGGWPVLIISFSHCQCTVGVFIIAQFARAHPITDFKECDFIRVLEMEKHEVSDAVFNRRTVKT